MLAFPCDQFGHQEAGSDPEIAAFCDRSHGLTVPVFARIDVNGPRAHPLHVWLKQQKGGLLGSGIKWNFTKFRVDKAGVVCARIAPTTPPEGLSRDVAARTSSQLDSIVTAETPADLALIAGPVIERLGAWRNLTSIYAKDACLACDCIR